MAYQGAPDDVPVPLRRTLTPGNRARKGGGMNENTFDRDSLGFEASKLLDVLLEHVDENGSAQVPTATLLEDSGLTQGALVRARSELTRQFVLRTQPGFSASGLRGANVYTLSRSVLAAPSSPSEPVEDGSEEPSTLEGSTPVSHRKPKPRWKKLFGSSRDS